ncbi:MULTISPECIES: deoxyribodipyrimidine photo-lyase [unclassified Corynebacterium]|nr:MULTISPECIES: deoxyribodipyrimidine photo-lyase [unclassified Corynebacterium]MCG7288626.1 deoxyribodipyrimidine photo-lyase [Corynebacterium sp. ACRPZ]MCG7293068.1 deoxyribodipyrimidine photo-lyase [Corynebacterium sp. ACRPY]
MPTTLLWFRDDLRVTDNPALSRAVSRGEVAGVLLVTHNNIKGDR